MSAAPQAPDELIDAVRWNADGLVAAIAQDAKSGTVLMMAWMNAESLRLTVETGHAVYYSRSRQALWHKGESSGNQQNVESLHLDCDGDTVLLKVEQIGGIACHTGREHCFFREWNDGWPTTEAVITDPAELYGSSS